MATATNNRAAAANRNHNSITPSNMRLPDLTSLLFQSTTITDDLALTKGIVPRKVINLTEQPQQIDAWADASKGRMKESVASRFPERDRVPGSPRFYSHRISEPIVYPLATSAGPDLFR